MASAQSELLIGVDVGTEIAKREIRTWHGNGGVVEQSTDQIWHCVVEGVREVSSAEIRVGRVIGIGFCATCSLAVIAAQGEPLRVGKSGESEAEENGICWERNVIVWMDQRAATQAERINSLGHSVLRFTGGRISPEMQAAKLLWLKENVPDSFYRAAHFFDLADFCTWRATESDERSICTLTCKWTFLGHEKRWDEGFFRAIGLNEIVDQNFQKIGQKVLPLGAKVGSGLSPKAAKEFGLSTGTSVGVGLIDAHAGALGTMSGEQQQMALILGTSLCTMNLSREPIFVHGIWGKIRKNNSGNNNNNSNNGTTANGSNSSPFGWCVRERISLLLLLMFLVNMAHFLMMFIVLLNRR
ncbi:hypothetical protein niasHT_004994 [Heterodera trifolii]|uniref:Carbohydrate kinase FGGY N-terminal domain-containing protein n=1 Tax=Heterodera trifolii TaxID=157864 RepID=A0ABD2LR46_9BILA